MSISEVKPANDQVVVVQDPSNAENVKDGNTLKPRERAVIERALKRTVRWQRNHKLAEEHCKNGDALLEKGEYADACARYVDATVLWASNPVFYTKLAEAYIKCNLFAEAAHAATRALSLNPEFIEARYQRGLARAAQGLLKAAKIDFELILSKDSTHLATQSALSTILHELSRSSLSFPTLSSTPSTAFTPFNTPATATIPSKPQPPTSFLFNTTSLPIPTPTYLPTPTNTPSSAHTIDFSFPSPDPSTAGLYEPSLSDSSDCFHVGNGIPCRFYNTHPAGCGLGALCRYSHSPDEKSVRDNLGKNVCTYHLLSLCKFGPSKCVYSHSTQYLPAHAGAWWSTPKGIEKVRKVVELAETRKRGKAGSKKVEKTGESDGEKTSDGVKKNEGANDNKPGKANTPKSGQSWRAKNSPGALKSSKVVTPMSARQSLLKKPTTPSSKEIGQGVLVARYLRWTERGMEDLKMKDTVEVLVKG